MRYHKLFLFLLHSKHCLAINLLLLSLIATGQIPNGTWRDHLAYNRAHTIAITPNKVFCAMKSGGMLSYDKETSEKAKNSTVTGLSDVNISALAYSEEENVLIVGYKDGNIDFITDNDPVNLPDIETKSLQTSKTIYEITCYENYAFLSCHFGIVNIDLEKQEIKDTYMFGDGGTKIIVYDVAIFNNYIYAATENGIYKASLDAANLVDYNYWEHLENLPSDTIEYEIIEEYNNELFAVYNTDDGDKIIRIDSSDSYTNWEPISDTAIYQIDAYNDLLSVVTTNTTYFFNSSLNNTKSLTIQQGRDAKQDSDGTIYAAADFLGFYRFPSGESDGKVLSISGPRFNTTSSIHTSGDQVWVGSGSNDNPWVNGAAYNFCDETWTSLSTGYTVGLDSVGNFYKFAFDPNDNDHVYATAMRYGLYGFKNFEVVESYTRSNTDVLKNNIYANADVRFQGIDFDDDGNLWAIQDVTAQPVFVLNSDKEWEHLELNSSLFSSPENWSDLLVTSTGQIWILNLKDGIVVLDPQSDGSIEEVEFSIVTSGGVSFSRAYCLAEDKNGNIWVGTNSGPVIYSNANYIFDSESIYCSRAVISRNDGSGQGDPLLNYETVNDIYVDGGNRKWLATENSGLFLVSDDGLETLHSFNKDNSPLYSNNIMSVGVNEETGEVFISTGDGLIGYMGQATEATDDFSNVYVYPNPIYPNYEGDITISGTIEDAYVRITDISGNIVYETTSLGGQAIWNGYNYEGQRVKTGVYLVFMTNEDGSKTETTKLVFIH